MNPLAAIARAIRALRAEFGPPMARYEGATWSTQRSWLQASTQSARWDSDSCTRRELVRKSRYFERNSPLVNRMADVFEAYVVGQGLVLQPASSSSEWNAAAKSWWDIWCRYPDLTSLQTFGTLQSLIARTWFIDGEVFIIKNRGDSGRPRIQLVEGHLVNTPPDFAKDPKVIDGIRVDSRGRPESYYIAEENAERQLVYGSPTPASSVIHVMEPGRPGQYRGLPFVYPTINLLHDLDDLQILEMRRAKRAARVVDVLKRSSGELSAEKLRQSRYTVSNTTSLGTTSSETRVKHIEDILGAETIPLMPGEDYSQVGAVTPSVATREYWRLLQESICIGTGFPLVVILPDSMQGTVYRGSLDMAAAFFRARSSVIAAACRDVWEYVIGVARYQEKELSDPPADWFKVTIQPPRAITADIGRNSSALLQELAAGATTWDQHYSSLGLDWREQFQKLAEQQAYARELGLALSFPGMAPPAQPEDAPDDPEDGSDEEEEDAPPVPQEKANE